MKVYVVVGYEAYEDSVVCGVYESHTLADEAIANCRDLDEKNDYFKKLYTTSLNQHSATDRAVYDSADWKQWHKRRCCDEFKVQEVELNAAMDEYAETEHGARA